MGTLAIKECLHICMLFLRPMTGHIPICTIWQGHNSGDMPLPPTLLAFQIQSISKVMGSLLGEDLVMLTATYYGLLFIVAPVQPI